MSSSAHVPLPPSGTTGQPSASDAHASWEARFPTFVGGSHSIAVARPTTTAMTASSPSPLAQQRPSVAASPAVTANNRPSTAERRLRRMVQDSRSGAGGAYSFTQAAQIPTPAQALQAAIDSRMAVLDYSSASIVPGNTSANSTMQLSSSHTRGAGRSPSPTRRGGYAAPPVSLGSTGVGGQQAPVDEGFHLVDAAMARLHHRLYHLPLDERWHAMATWLNKFVMDQEADELTRVIDVVWRRLLSAHPPQQLSLRSPQQIAPNGLRTGVSMMLLEQVLALVGRGVPQLVGVCGAIRDDIINSIYVVSVPAGQLAKTFQPLEDPNDVRQQQYLIERFYNKTYYQALREMSQKHFADSQKHEAMIVEREKKALIMERAINYRTQRILSMVFGGWKGYVNGRKKKIANLQKESELVTTLEKKTQLIEEMRDRHAQEIDALQDALTLRSAEVATLEVRVKYAQDQEAALRRQMQEQLEDIHNSALVKQLKKEIKLLKKRLQEEMTTPDASKTRNTEAAVAEGGEAPPPTKLAAVAALVGGGGGNRSPTPTD